MLLYHVAKSSRNKRARFDAGYGKRALTAVQVPEYRYRFDVYKRAALSLSLLPPPLLSDAIRSWGGAVCMPGDLLHYYIVILLLPVHLDAETRVHVSAEKSRCIETKKKNYGCERQEEKKGRNGNLSKSARLDYFGRDGTRPFLIRCISEIGRSHGKGARRCGFAVSGINRKVSMPACLPARRKETRLRNFAVDVHREQIQPMSLAEPRSGLLRWSYWILDTFFKILILR